MNLGIPTPQPVIRVPVGDRIDSYGAAYVPVPTLDQYNALVRRVETLEDSLRSAATESRQQAKR